MQKNSFRLILCSLLTVLLVGTLCSCQAKTKEPVQKFPFTTLNFSSTYDDMVALEGESTDTYKSVFGGTTYTYPKQYMDQEGTIKYMFNEKNELMSIAWAYSANEADDLYALYDQIHSEVETVHGKSGYNANTGTNYGDVWELETYHIIISTMLTDTNKALQYAYTKVV